MHLLSCIFYCQKNLAINGEKAIQLYGWMVTLGGLWPAAGVRKAVLFREVAVREVELREAVERLPIGRVLVAWGRQEAW